MAVPDTNTFSLQDVVDEINPTTDDLQDCINDAIEGNYDPNYYTAPATSLLEFRNYGGPASFTTRISNIVFVSYTSMENINITVENNTGSNPLEYDIEFSPNLGSFWSALNTFPLTFTGTTYTQTIQESIPFNTDPKWFRIYDRTNNTYSEVYIYKS